MTEQQLPEVEFEHDDFDFASLEEEVRVNERCQSLLNSFYNYLIIRGEDPQVASDLAFCADRYVRDYLLDFARLNVVQPVPGVIRRFAATWFITHTLDPEMPVLERYLKAIVKLYAFLQSQHFISREELSWLEAEASLTDYYGQRIESFLAIKGDEFAVWEAECPLNG
ncbi:MAG: hypothetical protein HXX11_06330 [Desulfuromonadales bacterium]|nr:hypothetical protein [Desulfuromonadales bacterium]